MAEQMRPASPKQAPDPATSYERAKPHNESGMGGMDNNDAVPAQRPDGMVDAVRNKQPLRQINSHDVVNGRASQPARGTTPGQPSDPSGPSNSSVASNSSGPSNSSGLPVPSAPAPDQPDHSMKEEEPDGWDMAPSNIHNPRAKRHPRTEGKGGTP